ncbi:MAG TPA: type II toxin-antitoxin system PemK/MazF family toxin [Gemmataceae bacterium]|nr:type II toxin-antitoxin system PemK/MazF family toxin [Gemmataceae bacterium]
MKVSRGDVVLTRFPHAGGVRGKKRPALVVQADAYNAKLGHVIIAEITTNLTQPTTPPSFSSMSPRRRERRAGWIKARW